MKFHIRESSCTSDLVVEIYRDDQDPAQALPLSMAFVSTWLPFLNWRIERVKRKLRRVEDIIARHSDK